MNKKISGCLPFTVVNRSVKGLGKRSEKFRTGEFRPGTAFSICTNQFHLPRNGLECLKLAKVSKMALKEMKHKFPFGTFTVEMKDYLFRPALKFSWKFSTELTEY